MNGASRTTAWLLALMAGAGLVVGAVYPVSGPPPAPKDSARGRAIFLEHCSICHGAEGRGDGSSAWLMKPRPRDFTRGEFRLVSTMNGVPTDDDLYSVITHGFRGTAMMPWGDRLSAADRRLLVDVVKALWRAGRARAYSQAGLEPAEVERLVREDLTPGRPVSCRVDVDPTPASLARGRVVYERECGRCHGADGRGVSDPSLVNSRGDAAPSMRHSTISARRRCRHATPWRTWRFAVAFFAGAPRIVAVARRCGCGTVV